VRFRAEEHVMKTPISALVLVLLLAGIASSADAGDDMPSVGGRSLSAQARGASPARPDGDEMHQDRARFWRPASDGAFPLTITLAPKQQLALAASKAMTFAKSRFEPIEQREDIVIDVIVAYTRGAAKHYTDIRRDLVDLAIEEANESFRLSNLAHIRLCVAHAYETDYVEEGSHFDHLWRFTDKGDGYMDEVHYLRDEFHADIGILIVDDPKGCGLATRVHAESDEAFAVAHHECAAANYTLAHEVGHLIGASHDLSYFSGNKWRDIMGSKESCGGCPRLPVWSSPMVLVNGEPAGTADRDNARVIAEQAARVAAFR